MWMQTKDNVKKTNWETMDIVLTIVLSNWQKGTTKPTDHHSELEFINISNMVNEQADVMDLRKEK